MSRQQIENLLERYLQGEASAHEQELVERWLEDSGRPYSEWDQLNASERAQWLSAVFRDINETIHVAEPAKIKRIGKATFLNWQQLTAAAAILIVVCAFLYQRLALQKAQHAGNMVSIVVPAHQIKHLQLADGSLISVNSGSTFRYPKKFKNHIREVYLSGEAFFDVRHDAAKPFMIHTGKFVTTVLGTAFNIRENKSTNTLEVTVTRGKVRVASDKKVLGIVLPNEQMMINSSKEEAIKEIVDANKGIAWQKGDLHFDDVSFAEAALQLQQRFKVKISLNNPKLKDCRFTGTALSGEKLEKILRVICAFNNATYRTLPDGSILIDGQGCN